MRDFIIRAKGVYCQTSQGVEFMLEHLNVRLQFLINVRAQFLCGPGGSVCWVLRLSSLCSLQDLGNCFRDTVPVGAFSGEPFLSGFGEFIELCATIVFRHSPLRLYPATFLHAIKRGIKRTIFDLEQVLSGFVYSLDD